MVTLNLKLTTVTEGEHRRRYERDGSKSGDGSSVARERPLIFVGLVLIADSCVASAGAARVIVGFLR